MPWITLDCGLDEHPKFLGLPNDSARLGWVMTLLAAKRQRTPGRFASEVHYRGVLHRYAKHLPHYLSAGLLERHEDGALLVHDWPEYQRDPAGRQALHRDKSVTPSSQTRHKEVTPRARGGAVPVHVPVSVVENGGVGLGEGEAGVFAFLAQHGAAIREDSGYGRRLLGLIERRGAERVLETAWDMARSGKLSDRQWTFGLEARLEPPEDGKEAVKKERQAELDRDSARGFAATQRYLAEQRALAERSSPKPLPKVSA